MSDNKPPMTVWLAFDAVDCFDRNEDCAASDPKNHHHLVGPYVLTDWLKEELLKRSKEGMRGYESPEKYSMELGRAIKDIFIELNRGENEL